MTSVTHLLEEVSGVSLEVAEGMDILTNIEHMDLCSEFASDLMLSSFAAVGKKPGSTNASTSSSLMISNT
jgi:hypothetical protein